MYVTFKYIQLFYLVKGRAIIFCNVVPPNIIEIDPKTVHNEGFLTKNSSPIKKALIKQKILNDK